MTKGKWTTKDGREMSLKEMEVSHLQNTIKMLERNMPDNEEDEWMVADHWSLGAYHVTGAATYREKIAELKAELATRSNDGTPAEIIRAAKNN